MAFYKHPCFLVNSSSSKFLWLGSIIIEGQCLCLCTGKQSVFIRRCWIDSCSILRGAFLRLPFWGVVPYKLMRIIMKITRQMFSYMELVFFIELRTIMKITLDNCRKILLCLGFMIQQKLIIMKIKCTIDILTLFVLIVFLVPAFWCLWQAWPFFDKIPRALFQWCPYLVKSK